MQARTVEMSNGVGGVATTVGDQFKNMKTASTVVLGLNQFRVGVGQDRNLAASRRNRQVDGHLLARSVGVKITGGEGIAAGGGAVELNITVGSTVPVVFKRCKAMANVIVTVQVGLKSLFPTDQGWF